jgi:CheY-like chemotaxis protein
MMKKILIVDDEEDIRLLVRDLLEEQGYKIKEAEDGKKCLKILDKEKFDLILLDFFMPGMSGREVADAIRNNPKTKSAKLAFLTIANFGEEGKIIIKKLKSLDYINKPVDNEDFVKRVKKITG